MDEIEALRTQLRSHGNLVAESVVLATRPRSLLATFCTGEGLIVMWDRRVGAHESALTRLILVGRKNCFEDEVRDELVAAVA